MMATVRHVTSSSGLQKISGLLIFVEQRVQVEAAYKAEITSIAEYLNTNYKVDQFVNIVKSYECTQPTMNSIIKTAAKIAELSQPNEKSDAKL